MSITQRRNRTPEYIAWCNIKQRCYDPNYRNSKNYKGRGITICDEWLYNYKAFHNYIGDKPEPKHKYSLDRIDNNGNYEPGNVRWATYTQQARNMKTRSSSGYPGVNKTKHNTWTSMLCCNYKLKYLGTFKTVEEAIAARRAGEIEYWGQ